MVKKTTTAAPAAARLKKAVAGFKARLKGLEVTADKTVDEADEADTKEALKAAASVLTLAADRQRERQYQQQSQYLTMLQEYQPRKEQERQWEISRKERQWERQMEEERSLIPAR
ncbi:hypothetical protein FRACYDRAFT_250364 [Fragilariopsis cylindrus CCMP1102]|uniref:Uncharacterized protein n=1 Tax=Fragilariopsis cylindrus CCMP1102 TaxID=635003 RepID=A0A1E7EQP4_9STRA|nr:hypothetical protein FRACYDRAFT_250364 [Fragilariopsis cylindrus CCMP1102]|eukprot:OEU08137.1 hypothetical protein FRACYDRAFT_250364 [Fragilariopsis cylindrus CCMP1102]